MLIRRMLCAIALLTGADLRSTNRTFDRRSCIGSIRRYNHLSAMYFGRNE
jgi:hypothetical protein